MWVPKSSAGSGTALQGRADKRSWILDKTEERTVGFSIAERFGRRILNSRTIRQEDSQQLATQMCGRKGVAISNISIEAWKCYACAYFCSLDMIPTLPVCCFFLLSIPGLSTNIIFHEQETSSFVPRPFLYGWGKRGEGTKLADIHWTAHPNTSPCQGLGQESYCLLRFCHAYAISVGLFCLRRRKTKTVFFDIDSSGNLTCRITLDY